LYRDKPSPVLLLAPVSTRPALESQTLDRLLPGPLETTQFLRFAVGLATALGGLPKKESN
jgi:hypothetical protein